VGQGAGVGTDHHLGIRVSTAWQLSPRPSVHCPAVEGKGLEAKPKGRVPIPSARHQCPSSRLEPPTACENPAPRAGKKKIPAPRATLRPCKEQVAPAYLMDLRNTQPPRGSPVRTSLQQLGRSQRPATPFPPSPTTLTSTILCSRDERGRGIPPRCPPAQAVPPTLRRRAGKRGETAAREKCKCCKARCKFLGAEVQFLGAQGPPPATLCSAAVPAR